MLQERELERVGGYETIKVNVRIITATNKNLEEAVKKGEFRSDLYYRLNVFPIDLPPLRERIDDISILSTYFMNKYSKKIGKTINRIGENTLNKLIQYNWPGNVRELENIIERAVILCKDNILNISENLFCSSETRGAARF